MHPGDMDAPGRQRLLAFSWEPRWPAAASPAMVDRRMFRPMPRRIATLALALSLVFALALVAPPRMAHAETMSMSISGRNAAPDGVVIFKPGSKELAPGSMPVIDRLVAAAKSDYANWVLLKACRGDFRSGGINLALRQERMDEIEREMAARGIPAHRIRGISSDEKCADDEKETAEKPIPRVEVRIGRFTY